MEIIKEKLKRRVVEELEKLFEEVKIEQISEIEYRLYGEYEVLERLYSLLKHIVPEAYWMKEYDEWGHKTYYILIRF